MLKWCVIGSGDVVNRLLKNSLNINKKSKVKYILGDNLNQLKETVKKIKVDNFYLRNDKNINKIINDKEVNSIYIATPPDSHLFYIKKFCRSKLNLVCEKPLVRNLKELNEIKILKKKYNFNLLTCFYRRYLNRFLKIKKILDKKVIGDIIYFNVGYFHSEKNHPTANINNKKIPWRFKKKISGGGNVLDMGIHSIDLIEYFIDEISEIQKFNNNFKKLYDVDDTTIVNFKLKNNILGQGSWCSVSNEKKDFFEIIGTKGSLKFKINYGEDENIYILKKGTITKTKMPYNLPLHKNMMITFVKTLLKANKEKKRVFFQNGLRTVKTLDKIVNVNY